MRSRSRNLTEQHIYIRNTTLQISGVPYDCIILIDLGLHYIYIYMCWPSGYCCSNTSLRSLGIGRSDERRCIRLIWVLGLGRPESLPPERLPFSRQLRCNRERQPPRGCLPRGAGTWGTQPTLSRTPSTQESDPPRPQPLRSRILLWITKFGPIQNS